MLKRPLAVAPPRPRPVAVVRPVAVALPVVAVVAACAAVAVAVLPSAVVVAPCAAVVAAETGVIINRNVNRNFQGGGGGPVVGRRYHGGTWYGTGRRFWRGQWYAYGSGPCWLLSPIGYVWIC